MIIIGRQREKKQLQRILDSNQAEFVAVYGRRRVGKTYLIREFFQEKEAVFFRTSGILDAPLKTQLYQFKKEIEDCFYHAHKGIQLAPFESWFQAFEALKSAIDLFGSSKKIVLFLDEIPWLATSKSGFLQALDFYWNRYWSEDARIKLIVCGSAASWIIEKILHNTGGLHNRITLKLPIAPFNLSETQDYLLYKNIRYNHQQILTLYMCLGGIPYYLNFVEKGLSATQNINQICFQGNGGLYDEFKVLFASLFKNHDVHEKIIHTIAKKHYGISRKEIEKALNQKGGTLSLRLRELEEAGFIKSFMPQNKQRGMFYSIIDEYSLFYVNWIEPTSKQTLSHDANWDMISTSPAYNAWSGLAFEAVCFKHIENIKYALNIPKGSNTYSWYHPNDKNAEGAQIDLVFDRPDDACTLCEIKYSKEPFIIDKKYAQTLINRAEIYKKISKTNQHIFHAMMTANGLKMNMYSEALISNCANLEALFNDSL